MGKCLNFYYQQSHLLEKKDFSPKKTGLAPGPCFHWFPDLWLCAVCDDSVLTEGFGPLAKVFDARPKLPGEL